VTLGLNWRSDNARRQFGRRTTPVGWLDQDRKVKTPRVGTRCARAAKALLRWLVALRVGPQQLFKDQKWKDDENGSMAMSRIARSWGGKVCNVYNSRM
jgi:hypothetical protein